MLWQVIGMVAVITVVAASIALHEFGHLVPAKRFGVRVSDYAIGFGPVLFSRRIGETLYSLRAIPLGGFIRMIGMLPPGRRAAGTSRRDRLAEEARAESMAEVLPSDLGRTFHELTVGRRSVVMLGGPLMNLIFATLLFGVALVGIGIPAPSAVVDRVLDCRFSDANPDGARRKDGTCAEGESAAVMAGLKRGDRVVEINGDPVTDRESFTTALEAAGAKGPKGSIVVRSEDGTTRTHDVVFQIVQVDRFNDAGEPTGERYPRAYIGFMSQWLPMRMPVTTVPTVMWSMTTSSLHAMAAFPQKVWDLGRGLVTGAERDPNGPVSIVGVTRIGGEIASADAQNVDKILNLLMLGGSLNLFLFLFNLLPLLPLDGGHVAAAAWEAVRDFIRRRRGAASLGPVDTARLLPLTYAMSTILIIFGAVVILADIVKPITLGV